MKEPKKVKTISGLNLPLANCRFMYGKFYKKGNRNIENSGDVYYIEEQGKWYREETEKLFYDHREKKYNIRSIGNLITSGVVGLDEEGAPIIGEYSNPDDTYILFPIQLYFKGSVYRVMDESILENQYFFKEALKDGVYYPRNSMPAKAFDVLPSCDQNNKRNLEYNCDNSIKTVKKHYEKLYKPGTPSNKYFSRIGRLFSSEFTFGLEFETSKGKLLEKDCATYGLIPVRDGSITGYEYATIPYKGLKGIQTVFDALEVFKKKTRYDETCSLHIHMAGLKRDPAVLLAAFKVFFLIQQDMYDMFPLYKSNYQLSSKKKDYTAGLPLPLFLTLDSKIDKDNLLKNFTTFFEYLSMGQEFSNYENDLNNVEVHPSDPRGTSKWNIKTRYSWINFIPIVFGNKKTIEFRLHTNSFNYEKILNFLILMNFIIRFCNEKKDDILSGSLKPVDITLKNIIRNQCYGHYGSSSEFARMLERRLNNYIKKRKDWTRNQSRMHNFDYNENNFSYRPNLKLDPREEPSAYDLKTAKTTSWYEIAEREVRPASNNPFRREAREVLRAGRD